MESWFILYEPHVFARTKRLHAGSTQPTSLRLPCPNVLSMLWADDEGKCYGQGDLSSWIDMMVQSLTGAVPCLLQLKWRTQETRRLQRINRLPFSVD